jgi:murein DD-endopeptidase MepM/ murein hydrolase activator NlpD
VQVFPIPAGVHYKICGYWGDPRPNGRTHQGIDLCCPEGTPLLAVADGVLKFGTDPLGGNVATLTIADGSHYYYAHMAHDAGSGPRTVSAGDIVGYCGHSGDAQANLPHLHFGRYINGVAVDPGADLATGAHMAAPVAPSAPWAALAGAAILLAAAAAAAHVYSRA